MHRPALNIKQVVRVVVSRVYTWYSILPIEKKTRQNRFPNSARTLLQNLLKNLPGASLHTRKWINSPIVLKTQLANVIYSPHGPHRRIVTRNVDKWPRRTEFYHLGFDCFVPLELHFRFKSVKAYQWMESMKRIEKSNQWIEPSNRINESKQWVEAMKRSNESNPWIEAGNRISESNQGIESMYRIHEPNQWIERVNWINEKKRMHDSNTRI